jgi:16S rRNA (guanine1207-N2)-methyltransferase
MNSKTTPWKKPDRGSDNPKGEHYYSVNPQVESDPGSIRFKAFNEDFVLSTDRGVFSKDRLDRGTELIIESIEKGKVKLPSSGNVCDLGCGYGPIGLVVARLFPDLKVYMSDINQRAVDLARTNVEKLMLKNVTVKQGAGLMGVFDTRFDLIFSNPPLRAGKAVVYDLMSQAHQVLNPSGRLVVVCRTQQGAKSLAKYLAELFLKVVEVNKGSGYRVYEAYKA